MKIGVNTRTLLKNKMEGVAVFTAEVMKRITNDHPEHEFYFFFDRPYDQSFIFAENVTPVVLFPQARHPFLFVWWFEWSITRALNKYEIDLFISPDNFCSLTTSVPTLLVVHDVAFKHYPEQVGWLVRQYYNFFMPRFLRKADTIVAVSKFTKEDLKTQFQLSNKNIAIACNGTNSHFKAIESKVQKTIKHKYTGGFSYFVFVGLIHPRKNVHRLIPAFYQFKERTGSDLKLVLVGRKGWMADEVKDALRHPKFEKEVIFTGFVDHEEIPKIIGSAFAMMYVSLFEGFGIPILEAFHTDTPVITSDRSSMPEVGGEAVLYANPTSIDSIAEQMIRLYQNADLQKDLIEKGKQQRTLFTWGKAAHVVYEQIEKIAKQNSIS